MNAFPWLIALCLIALAWWNTLGAKATARRAARAACADAQVRFIDELAIKRLTLGYDVRRDLRRRYCIKRFYEFEFYWGGEQRSAGEVVMHGQRVVAVSMDPYPL